MSRYLQRHHATRVSVAKTLHSTDPSIHASSKASSPIVMASFWNFPLPAPELQLPPWNTTEFNSAISNYLTQQATNVTTNGFGSNGAVFIDDTIDVHWGIRPDSEVERYCLVCSQPYLGTEGWPACGYCMYSNMFNSCFTNMFLQVSPDNGPKLYVAYLGKDNHFEHLLTELNDQANISAAVCAFGGNLPSRYELTSAFPLINRNRDDGRPYTFTAREPGGIDSEEYNSTRTTTSSTSTTSRIPTATSTGDFYSDPTTRLHESGMSKGEIITAAIGAVVGFSIVAFMVFRCWRNHQNSKGVVLAATQKRKLRSAKSQNRPNDSTAQRVRPASRQPPRPFVRDRLSAAERGDSLRQETVDDLPPPTYEEAITSTASDTDRADRESTDSIVRNQPAGSR